MVGIGGPVVEGEECGADQAGICPEVGGSQGWHLPVRPGEDGLFEARLRGSQKQVASGDESATEDYELWVKDVYERGDPDAEPIAELVE